MCVRQVARLLALVPPWVRVYRIQRDIPMPLVTSGVEKGNLRELALARMGQLGLRCRDVRTREVGIQVSCPSRQSPLGSNPDVAQVDSPWRRPHCHQMVQPAQERSRQRQLCCGMRAGRAWHVDPRPSL